MRVESDSRGMNASCRGVVSATKKAVHSGEEVPRDLSNVVGRLGCEMPTKRSSTDAVSDSAQLCPHCVDESWHLKSCFEVFEHLVTRHSFSEKDMSRPEEEKVARQLMCGRPAWEEAVPGCPSERYENRNGIPLRDGRD